MLFETMGVGNYLKLSTQAESKSFTLPACRLQPDDRRFRIDDKATLDPIGDSVGLAAPYGQNNQATDTPILKRIWPTGPPLLKAEN
ncbi:MAG: hypothetical protein VB875_06890 [Pirellulales bacterium]